MIRLTLYILLAIFIALAAAWISSNPGEVLIHWQGWEVRFSVAVSVLLFIAYTGLILGLLWLLKWLNVAAYFSSPERLAAKRAKAQQDLDQGWSSYALGDYADAIKFGLRAKSKLGEDHSVLRLLARATQKQGDLVNPYADALKQSAISSTWVEKRELDNLVKANSWPAAKKLTAKLLERHPKNSKLLELDFLASAHISDWQNAKLALLNAGKIKGAIDTQKMKRYRAVIDYCLGLEAKAAGQKSESLALIKNALKQDPSFSAAVLSLARSHIEQSDNKAAEKTILNAWTRIQTSDLGDLYIELYPMESESETFRRVKKLTENSADPTSLHLRAQTAIGAEKWPEARDALDRLLNEEAASNKTFHLLAQLERTQKNDTDASETFLAKAENAPEDPKWKCSNCKTTSAHYLPICPTCQTFDSVKWTSAN